MIAGADAPRGVTVTSRGTPVRASAHTSTRPTVVSGARGVIRTPGTDRPATRFAPTADSSDGDASAARRRPNSGGSRSWGRARRTGWSPSTSVARRRPASQDKVPSGSRYWSRSPTAVSTSVRQLRAPRYQVRIRVVVLSRDGTTPALGRSGRPRPARASA